MLSVGSRINQAGNAVRLYTLDDQGRRRRADNDATVVVANVLLGISPQGREIYGNIHVKVTTEGIITDAIVNGLVAGTACYPLDMLIDELNVS